MLNSAIKIFIETYSTHVNLNWSHEFKKLVIKRYQMFSKKFYYKYTSHFAEELYRLCKEIFDHKNYFDLVKHKLAQQENMNSHSLLLFHSNIHCWRIRQRNCLYLQKERFSKINNSILAIRQVSEYGYV